MARSASAKIRADIRRLRKMVDLARSGLGDKLCDIAGEAVGRNLADEQQPDGSQQPELSKAYAARKGRTYPGRKVLQRTGVMGAKQEVQGRRAIGHDEAK